MTRERILIAGPLVHFSHLADASALDGLPARRHPLSREGKPVPLQTNDNDDTRDRAVKS